jgi:cytochrome c biogenesis protein CcdA
MEGMVTDYRVVTTSVLFGLFLCILFPQSAVSDDNPPAEVVLEYYKSDECEDCLIVSEEILQPLAEQYPLHVIPLPVSEPENFTRLIELEKSLNDPDNDIPVIYAGGRLLSGMDEIESELEAVVLKVLTGNDSFTVEETDEDTSTGTGVSSTPRTGADADAEGVKNEGGDEDDREKLIHAAYFFTPGCASCSRLEYDIKAFLKKYPTLRVNYYDLSEREHKLLNEALCEKYHVEDEYHLSPPMIFVGEDVLIHSDAKGSRLEQLIVSYLHSGAPSPEGDLGEDFGQSRETIIERFKTLGISTILSAGLLDGINPCAFATIIFFISYLSFVGRKGREILWVGISFSTAVFTTYLLVGLGVLKFFQTLSFLPFLAKIIYGITILMLLVLSGYSFYDFLQCRRGRTSDIKLQLPMFLKKRIHRVIREESKMDRYILATFATGFLVSILELACTGQVYLPTIIFVTKISHLRANAIFYLVLYNLMFITPLVVIFLLAYFGVTSGHISDFMERHMAAVKLCTTFLFIALAGILLTTFIV